MKYCIETVIFHVDINRCEMLMRAAERELAEIERKKQTADQMNSMSGKGKETVSVAGSNAESTLSKSRMETLMKEIQSESQRLAQARIQLSKMIKAAKSNPSNEQPDKAGASKLNAESTLVTGVAKSKPGPKSTSYLAALSAAAGTSAQNHTASGRSTAKPVPDEFIPELCRFIKALSESIRLDSLFICYRLISKSGPDGIAKVVSQFIANHPTISKRQVEIKIAEIGIKEKRADDTKQVLCLKIVKSLCIILPVCRYGTSATNI
jgi:hypothetical protein